MIVWNGKWRNYIFMASVWRSGCHCLYCSSKSKDRYGRKIKWNLVFTRLHLTIVGWQTRWTWPGKRKEEKDIFLKRGSFWKQLSQLLQKSLNCHFWYKLMSPKVWLVSCSFFIWLILTFPPWLHYTFVYIEKDAWKWWVWRLHPRIV